VQFDLVHGRYDGGRVEQLQQAVRHEVADADRTDAPVRGSKRGLDGGSGLL
jgi:hypothetical protein